MSQPVESFTIEQFYKFMAQGKLNGWYVPKMQKSPLATTPLLQRMRFAAVQLG